MDATSTSVPATWEPLPYHTKTAANGRQMPLSDDVDLRQMQAADCVTRCLRVGVAPGTITELLMTEFGYMSTKARTLVQDGATEFAAVVAGATPWQYATLAMEFLMAMAYDPTKAIETRLRAAETVLNDAARYTKARRKRPYPTASEINNEAAAVRALQSIEALTIPKGDR